MKNFLISYGISFISLLVLDFLWIVLIMGKIFRTHLGHLMAPNVNWWPALIFYILYAFGICFFIVNKNMLNEFSPWIVFASGLILGLIAYGTYDLTNHATLKNWPLFITIIDMSWGTLVTGVTALFTTWIMRIMIYR